MKILGLYNNELALELFQALQKQGHEVILWKEKLSASWCKEQKFDLAVSYTYLGRPAWQCRKSPQFLSAMESRSRSESLEHYR